MLVSLLFWSKENNENMAYSTFCPVVPAQSRPYMFLNIEETWYRRLRQKMFSACAYVLMLMSQVFSLTYALVRTSLEANLGDAHLWKHGHMRVCLFKVIMRILTLQIIMNLLLF